MARTIMVTGATDGIGFETARVLLANGARVLVHGRTAAKAGAAVKRLAVAGGDPWPVSGDLSRMREVIGLAAQVREKTDTLDVLVNNAGVYTARRELTDDGFELTMAVNHFAHFLLTRLLEPALAATAGSRVVNVSSMTHQSGSLDPADLTFASAWSPYGAYSNSKLANLLFTRELARRVADSGRVTNALHPGVIGTKLLRAGFALGGAPVTEGAKTSVYLATSEAGGRANGKYFVDCRETPPARQARDDALAARLWAESERLLAPFL